MKKMCAESTFKLTTGALEVEKRLVFTHRLHPDILKFNIACIFLG